MECGSAYVWIPDADEEDTKEIAAEAELGANLWDASDALFSTSSSGPQAPPPPPMAPQMAQPFASQMAQPFNFGSAPVNSFRGFQQQSMQKPILKKRVRQADTNVISIQFGNLLEGAHISTGDPIFCTQCNANFNVHSKINGNVWKCEFCDKENEVKVDAEEVPKVDTVDYIVGSVAQAKISEDSNTVIFCIDISGSMCVSYEVAGKFQFRGQSHLQKLETHVERNQNGLVADQWLPNERRDITYVTRLQCVQAAIDAQLLKLKKENPNRKVGIVTFNSEVAIVGDGAQQTEIVAGDKLNNYNQLLSTGEKYQLQKSIKDSCEALGAKLFSLEEGGGTALGPALLVAVGMCSKSGSGSSIVICTDGMSNVGLGALDDLRTDDEKAIGSQFYEQVGSYAKQHGISISVISIKGSDCSIENLGSLAELTAGNVDRVDPVDLSKNFASIMSSPVIATHVSTEIHLHKGLLVKSDEKEGQIVTDVGNVTQESTTTFEYGIRGNFDKKLFANLKELPFQIQIRYTKLDGMKCLRVRSNCSASAALFARFV
eukprot:TRINITY_DN888_c0_g1_i2.p1 TRINITY_DN888_c0_g1~~TRINITY_DN888_c0_g1_i2.p1  ORF type:complete len:545 (+),score=140.04 TRINITY_DN888_c0_g1_i2:103-1737(+)